MIARSRRKPRPIRSLLFLLFMAAITPPFALLALALSPLPPLLRYRIIGLWTRANLAALRLLCGVRYAVIGADHLPPPPFVILSRHESAWETLAFQVIFPPVVFVLKRELLRIPFFGWGLARMSPIAIDRAAKTRALREVLRQGRSRIAAGFCVVIFPEGTRMPPGIAGKFAAGGARLAADNNLPLVPVALNSGGCWPRRGVVKTPGEITVSIAPPLAAAPPAEAAAKAKAWIEKENARLSAPR